MGYSLNFYLSSLADIRLSMSHPNSRLFRKAYPHWLECVSKKDNKKSKEIWRGTVSSICEIVSESTLNPALSIIAPANESLAVLVSIGKNAELIDIMNHSSSSGELFRNQFLDWFGRRVFK